MMTDRLLALSLRFEELHVAGDFECEEYGILVTEIRAESEKIKQEKLAARCRFEAFHE